MARKINFKSKVAESLGKSDAIEFQQIIRSRLNESLNRKKYGIVSEMLVEEDFESQVVNQLAATASSFGCNDAVYDMGVMDIRFSDPNAVKQFVEKLDEVDGIDYFEVNEPAIDGQNDTGASDLEYQGNKPVYEVTVYLDVDQVSLVSDIDSYMNGIDSFQEAKEMDDEEEMEDEDEMDDDEECDDDEDEDDEDEMDEGCKGKKGKEKVEEGSGVKESIDFDVILDKSSLNEFLTIKTAHWDQALKRAKVSTDKICPPGRTGADCKTVLTAQQKMQLRKRMAAHLKKLSGARRSRMAVHAAATSAFIKQHNLMSKSAAKAGM